MKLSREEEIWLRAYCDELKKQLPGQIDRLSVFGSKARGKTHLESDLDILVIINSENASQKREARRIGYFLAADGKVIPSILAYSRQEWDRRKSSGSSFRRAVERDEVRIL